jgi:hypothetical protein
MLSKETFTLTKEQQLALKNHKFADFYPLMQKGGFHNLVYNVKDIGQINAIILNIDKTEIIAGRNLFMACIEAGIEPFFITFSGNDSEIFKFIIADKLRLHQSTSPRTATAVNSIEPYKASMGLTSDEEAIIQLAKLFSISPRQIKELKRIKSESQYLFNLVLLDELTVNKAKTYLFIKDINPEIYSKLENEEIDYDEAVQLIYSGDAELFQVFNKLKKNNLSKTDLPTELKRLGYDANNMPNRLICSYISNNNDVLDSIPYQNISKGTEILKTDDLQIAGKVSAEQYFKKGYSTPSSKMDNNITRTKSSNTYSSISSHDKENVAISDWTDEELKLLDQLSPYNNELISEHDILHMASIDPSYVSYANLHNESIKEEALGMMCQKEFETVEENNFLYSIGRIKLLNDKHGVPMNLDRATVLLDKVMLQHEDAISMLKFIRFSVPDDQLLESKQIDDLINDFEEEFLEKMARNDKMRVTKSME